MTEISAQNITDQANKKNTCFTCGCIAVIAVVVIILIFIGVSAFYSYRHMKEAVLQYSEDTAYTENVETLSPDEYRQFEGDFDKEVRAVNAAKATTIILNESQINSLIKNHSSFSAIKDSLAVRIEDNVLKMFFSINGSTFLDGKYLNGSVFLKPSGNTLKVKDVSVHGHELEDDAKKATLDFFERVLAQSLEQAHVSQATIADNKLSLTFNEKTNGTAVENDTAAETASEEATASAEAADI